MAAEVRERAAVAGLAKPLRGTQTIVSQMAWCWTHPSLTLLEVAWRWLFGAPFLLVAWVEANRILAAIPPEAAGLGQLNFQDPWQASVLLSDAFALYQPPVLAVLRWLLPAAAVGWAVLSGLGRNLVLRRMDPALPWRPVEMIALQGLFLLGLGGSYWLWFRGIAWAAANNIGSGGEPHLVTYFAWVIVLSLALFTVWALVSWVLSIAPLLLLAEHCGLFAGLGRGFRLGPGFTAKLIEVNLVMGIVKLALLVLAMVFSAAPLPFSDTFGPNAMQALYALCTLGYFVASDYFQVVRLKSFLEFWRAYRGA